MPLSDAVGKWFSGHDGINIDGIHGKGWVSVKMRNVQNHIEDPPIHDKMTYYVSNRIGLFSRRGQEQIVIALDDGLPRLG